ncbi:EexN family lipoprotein [Sphingobium sp. TomTYG75]
MAPIAALSLIGCGEDKSVGYYKAHVEEARRQSAQCLHHADAGANCGHAAIAIQEIAGDEFRRAQKRTRQVWEKGAWQPKWKDQ